MSNSTWKFNDGDKKTYTFSPGGSCEYTFKDLFFTRTEKECVWEQDGKNIKINVNRGYFIQEGIISGETIRGRWKSLGAGTGSFSARVVYFDKTISVASKPKQNNPNKPRSSSGAAGTAFFITPSGHLITNYHVIEPCNNNSKIVHKTKETPVRVIAKDKLLDLALLKAEIKKTDYIVLSEDPPKKLQKVIAAGYPLGKSLSDDLKFTSGIVSSLKGLNDDSTLIQIDAALNKGNSGGPIVDENSGELLAVAVSGLSKAKTEAVNFGIKTNSLKNFLNSNQIKTPSSKLLFSFGNTDVSSLLENTTVYTYCKN